MPYHDLSFNPFSCQGGRTWFHALLCVYAWRATRDYVSPWSEGRGFLLSINCRSGNRIDQRCKQMRSKTQWWRAVRPKRCWHPS